MEAWLERLIEERNLLEKNILKLEIFLSKNKDGLLIDPGQKDLQLKQLEIEKELLAVLCERISLELNKLLNIEND